VGSDPRNYGVPGAGVSVVTSAVKVVLTLSGDRDHGDIDASGAVVTVVTLMPVAQW
jgi:hypothetical protein